MQQTFQMDRSQQAQLAVSSFIRSVYNWMAIGLALTGGIALFVASNDALLEMFVANQFMFLVLLFGELGLVFYISARISKIEASTATALFLIYAALNGVTLSVLFLAFTKSSIASTFFICAATFGACSVYGMVTKKDLTGMGQFMMMGLFGIIIASVVNWFMQSPMFYALISYIGVFVFVGLTAFDTQKLKQMAISQPAGLDAGVVRKGAILGALTLYLDFINMFIFLLRIFGDRR